MHHCPHIQARLGGHESITTTIDTYGHLLPAGDELISGIIDTALTGGTIRPSSGSSTGTKAKGKKSKKHAKAASDQRLSPLAEKSVGT